MAPGLVDMRCSRQGALSGWLLEPLVPSPHNQVGLGPGSWLALDNKTVLTRARPPDAQQWAQPFLREMPLSRTPSSDPNQPRPKRLASRLREGGAISPRELSASPRVAVIRTLRRCFGREGGGSAW